MPAFDAIGHSADLPTIFAMTRFARMTGGSALVLAPERTRGGMATTSIFGSDSNNTGTSGWGLWAEFCAAILALDPFAADATIYGKPNAFWFEPHTAYAALATVYADAGAGSITFAHRKKIKTVVKDERAMITSVIAQDLDTAAETEYTSNLWYDGHVRGGLARPAGVTMRNWREPRSQHNIINAGVNTKYLTGALDSGVFRNARGDILKGRQYTGEQEDGMGDRNTQVANVRTVVTNNPANRIAFPQPNKTPTRAFVASDFDDWVYWLNTTGVTDPTSILGIVDNIGDPADGKFSTNPGDGLSGKGSWSMGEATEEEFQRLAWEVQYEQLGRWWVAANDSRVTSSTLKTNMLTYGLCADEHTGALTNGDGSVRDPYGICPGMPELIYYRGDTREIGPRVADFREVWGGDPATLAKADRGTVRYQPPRSMWWEGYVDDLHAGRRATLPGGGRQEGGYGDDWSGSGTGSLFGRSMDEVLPHPSQARNLINSGTPSIDRLSLGQKRLDPGRANGGDACGAFLAACFMLGIPPGEASYEQILPYLIAAGAPRSFSDVQHMPS